MPSSELIKLPHGKILNLGSWSTWTYYRKTRQKREEKMPKAKDPTSFNLLYEGTEGKPNYKFVKNSFMVPFNSIYLDATYDIIPKTEKARCSGSLLVTFQWAKGE